MGWARSCYRRRMRFVAGDTTKFAVVQWYRCKPTAKPFPALHRFGPAIWDVTRGEVTDLGDDATASMTWVSGANPNLSDGTTFAGPLDYFVNGAPAPGVLARLPDGTPVDCVPFPGANPYVLPTVDKSASYSVLASPEFTGIAKGCGYVIVV